MVESARNSAGPRWAPRRIPTAATCPRTGSCPFCSPTFDLSSQALLWGSSVPEEWVNTSSPRCAPLCILRAHCLGACVPVPPRPPFGVPLGSPFPAPDPHRHFLQPPCSPWVPSSHAVRWCQGDPAWTHRLPGPWGCSGCDPVALDTEAGQGTGPEIKIFSHTIHFISQATHRFFRTSSEESEIAPARPMDPAPTASQSLSSC